MDNTTLTLIGIITTLIAGVLGYFIKGWMSGTSEDVKAGDKINQAQALEILALKGKIELMYSKIETIQEKSNNIQSKLDKIADNELVHLKQDMENQKDANTKDHNKLFIILTAMAEKNGISVDNLLK